MRKACAALNAQTQRARDPELPRLWTVRGRAWLLQQNAALSLKLCSVDQV